jgi:hypothetical protein
LRDRDFVRRSPKRKLRFMASSTASFGKWVRRVKDDPTTFATLVMAIFTVILTRQPCKQTAMYVATEHPVLTVNTAILIQDVAKGWRVAFPFKNFWSLASAIRSSSRAHLY